MPARTPTPLLLRPHSVVLAAAAAILALSPSAALPHPPAHAQSRDVAVRTPADLTRAIASAAPGDVITLAPGTYALPAKLAVTRPGTLDEGWLVHASRGATVSG